MKFNLPVNYNLLDISQRKVVREQYIVQQNGLCYYCEESLKEAPPKRITEKVINWGMFPDNFLKNPIHLQHCHDTGMTEGAVHAYCNAVMWQYESR